MFAVFASVGLSLLQDYYAVETGLSLFTQASDGVLSNDLVAGTPASPFRIQYSGDRNVPASGITSSLVC